MNNPVKNNGGNNQQSFESWHSLPATDVLQHLKVRDSGLTSAEAAERLAQYGPNQ